MTVLCTDHVTEGDREDAAGLMILHCTHVVQNVTTRLVLHVLVIPQQHSSLLLATRTHNHHLVSCTHTDCN